MNATEDKTVLRMGQSNLIQLGILIATVAVPLIAAIFYFNTHMTRIEDAIGEIRRDLISIDIKLETQNGRTDTLESDARLLDYRMTEMEEGLFK